MVLLYINKKENWDTSAQRLVNRAAGLAGCSGSLDGKKGGLEGWAAGLVNRSGSLDGKKGGLEGWAAGLVTRSGSLDAKKGGLDDKKGGLDGKKGDILAHLTCQNGYLTTRTALRSCRGGQLPNPCRLPAAQTYHLQHKKPQHRMPHGRGNKNREQMSLINWLKKGWLREKGRVWQQRLAPNNAKPITDDEDNVSSRLRRDQYDNQIDF